MVASDGPPCVRSHTCSKPLAVQIEDKSVVTVKTWRIPGSVTVLKRSQALAQSTRPASYNREGTPCSPARMEMNQNGKPRHDEAEITEPMAVEGWPSQSTIWG